jgi:hypothetical protein
MVAQDGDIRAVHGAAHVQAAGHGNAQMGRQRWFWKSAKTSSMVALTVPEASVAGVWQWIQPWVWTMLVMPAPVPPIGKLEAAAVKLAAFQILDQGLDLVLAVHHELDVVAGGETQVAVAVFFGNLTDFADVGGAHETRAAAADRVDLVAGFGHVDQNTGFQIFVIEPFALVLGDDRRVEFVVFFRTDVGDPVFHRFVRIVT